MPWAKVDDRFHSHPKVREAGLAAIGMWSMALSYCAAYSTDGRVPDSWVDDQHGDADAMRRRRKVGRALAARLIEVGMFERCEGGYVIHDYLDYNPSRAEVEAEKAKKSAAGKVGGLRSGASRREAKGEAPASGLLQEKTNPVPSRPVPDQKEKKEPALSPLEDTSSSRRKPAKAVEVPRPDDWKPTERHVDLAATYGFSRGDVERMADGFMANHDSKGKLFLDWDSAFGTWIVKEAGFDRREKREVAPPRKAPPVSPPRASVQANIDKLAAGEKLPQQILGWLDDEPEAATKPVAVAAGGAR